MTALSNSSGASSTLFVGSLLDDAGLDVYQFRILGHLHRRAGSDGRAWPAVATIAEVCKIGERVVRRSLRTLVKLGHVTAQPRPGRTTLYRPAECQNKAAPAVEPLADRPAPPLADKPDEGIPLKAFPTPTPSTRQAAAIAPSEPLEQPVEIVGVGLKKRKETVLKAAQSHLEPIQKDAAQALAENGIIGAKMAALARSGLEAKEIRKTCRRVSESGGRAGAMILHLEAAAGRKAEGHKLDVGFKFTPAKPLPEWEDTLSAEERAEVVDACRKFRQAG